MAFVRRLYRVLLKYLAWAVLGLFLAFGFAQYYTWIVLGWTFETLGKIYRPVRNYIARIYGTRRPQLWSTNDCNRCRTCRADDLQCNRRFDYPALCDDADSIRLISIFPGSESAIQYRLATFSLDKAPQYIALSYRWTSDDPDYAVCINGSTFHIRRNLHDFLKAMRHDGFFGWIFVDAICINQHDIRERSHQVALMRTIYTKADEVVAWLQCDDKRLTFDGKQVTIRSFPLEVRKALQKVDDDINSSPEFAALPPEALEMAKAAVQKYARDKLAERLKSGRESIVWQSFLEDDYWTRLWPVQEILLAKNLTFRCRNVSFDWVDLQILVEGQTRESHGLYDKAQLPPHRAYQHARDDGPLKMGAHKLTMMSELLWRKKHQQEPIGDFNPSIPLYEAVIQFAGQKCTDPRDKIFGLVGICQAKLKPDYNMPLSEVYLRTLVEGLVEIFEEHLADSVGISSAASLKKITTFCWALRYALGLDEMSSTVSLITKEVLHLFAPPRSMICDDLSWTGLPLDGILLRKVRTLMSNDVAAFAWSHFFLDKMYYDMSRTFFEGRYLWMGKFKTWATQGGNTRARCIAIMAEMIFGPLYLASRWPLVVHQAYDSTMTLPGGTETRRYSEWSKMSQRVFQDMIDEMVVPRKLYVLSFLEDNEEEIVGTAAEWLAKGIAVFSGANAD